MQRVSTSKDTMFQKASSNNKADLSKTEANDQTEKSTKSPDEILGYFIHLERRNNSSVPDDKTRDKRGIAEADLQMILVSSLGAARVLFK